MTDFNMQVTQDQKAEMDWLELLQECPDPLTQEVAHRVVKGANAESLVLFGETGTGKEVVAKALHQEGDRSNRPFVTINCAAISPNLAESELFGHVKGAFTGANCNRNGAFTTAHRGTLFLDEVGELPPPLQAKLLRAVDGNCYRPVGSDSDRESDVRIIVATNRDLKKMIIKGKFRADLFYRLNRFPIDIPPLRRRSKDIPFLAEKFLTEVSEGTGTFTKESLQIISAYSWPGNVRELRNTVRSVWNMLDGKRMVHTEDLEFLRDEPEVLVSDSKVSKTVHKFCERTKGFTLHKMVKLIVCEIIRQEEGDISKVAARLEILESQVTANLKD